MNLKRTAWTAGSITVAGAVGAGVLFFGASSAFADDDNRGTDRSNQVTRTDDVVLKREDSRTELVTVDDDPDDDPRDLTGDGITRNDVTRNDPARDGVTRDNTRDNTRSDLTTNDPTNDPTRDGVTRDLTPDLTRDNTR